jgi:hypothetical protein
MSFSLNEVEATARKATRGVGYPWGIADEAGKAVRWLCANGVDGCGALVGLLQMVDERDLETLKGGPFLCPLLAGCSYADHGKQDFEIAAVAMPVLLLPFIAVLARSKAIKIQLICTAGVATTDGDRLCLDCDLPDLSDCVIRQCQDFGSPNGSTSRAAPDPEHWAMLNAYAHRTYAPATEESRLKGAG